MNAVSRRTLGMAWAIVVCPLVGWSAALSANRATHGGLGDWAAGAILFLLPAALAAVVNLLLGRSHRSVGIAALLAVLVSAAGFAIYVAIFFLTVPDDFFT